MSKRTRGKYTDEFKDEVVKLITEQGSSIAEAARNLGVNANLPGRWKKEKENTQLKMEREIRKNAAAFPESRSSLTSPRNRSEVSVY